MRIFSSSVCSRCRRRRGLHSQLKIGLLSGMLAVSDTFLSLCYAPVIAMETIRYDVGVRHFVFKCYVNMPAYFL